MRTRSLDRTRAQSFVPDTETGTSDGPTTRPDPLPAPIHGGNPRNADGELPSRSPERGNIAAWSVSGTGLLGTRGHASSGSERPGGNADPVSGSGLPTHCLTADPIFPDPVVPIMPPLRCAMVLPKVSPDVPTGISLYAPTVDVQDAGSWQFARQLLDIGVLQETDWNGDLEQSVRRGLSHWVNVTLGAGNMRFLGPLRLSAVNDAREYFLHMEDSLWRQQLRARPHWPVGFFGLHWEGNPVPIFVADRIQELEAAFPGVGYGLIDLLRCAFEWTCGGLSFDSGADRAMIQEVEAHKEWIKENLEGTDPRELELDDKGEPTGKLKELLEEYWEITAAEDDLDEDTVLTLRRFHKLIPPETYQTKLNPNLLLEACREIEGYDINGWENGRAVGVRRRNNSKISAAQREKRRYNEIIRLMLNLLQHLNFCTRTHIGGSHLPLIYNAGQQMEPQPSVYLSWHPHDEMHRIVDDIVHERLDAMGGDIVWMHGFQLAHEGQRTGMADLWATEIAQSRPDLSPGFDFAPDGSLEAAVLSTSKCIRVCVVIDQILQWLHDGEDEAAFHFGINVSQRLDSVLTMREQVETAHILQTAWAIPSVPTLQPQERIRV